MYVDINMLDWMSGGRNMLRAKVGAIAAKSVALAVVLGGVVRDSRGCQSTLSEHGSG